MTKELDLLSETIPKLASNELMGNEDAVAWQSTSHKFTVLNVDSISWSTDVLPTLSFTPALFGRKCVVVTISDLAAKGVQPQYFLSAINVPSLNNVAITTQIIEGMIETCKYYSIAYIGGDLGQTQEISLTGVAVGFSDSLLKRCNAQAGDDIWVTNYFGWTGLAFSEAFNNIVLPVDLQNEAHKHCLYPEPQLVAGLLLSSHAHACLDSSDGLSISFNHLAREAKKTIILEKLPLDPRIKDFVQENKTINPKQITCFAGEEFELVFTLPKGYDQQLKDLFTNKGLQIPIKIGSVIEGRIEVLDATDKNNPQPLEESGWDSLK